MKTLRIPDFSLVVLVGASGSGKSTFAGKHFLPTEVLSSDTCRGLVSDDENSQSATGDAFDVLHYIAGKRLAARRLTVVDATNVQQEARRPLVRLAREHHCLPVAIVLDLDQGLCEQRNDSRANRDLGPHVVRAHVRQLRRSLRHLKREGFRQIEVLGSVDEIEQVSIERVPLWTDRRDESGPFDIVGDIHGCYAELRALLETLGYTMLEEDSGPNARHPSRRAVFVGDLVDRGPASPDVLRLVMNMVRAGHALCVPGNHEIKLLRKLRGRDVQITHGLAETLSQLESQPRDFIDRVAEFIDGLVSHYVLDGGRLVVAHAGLAEELQGRASGRVRSFALYGETSGETDEFGLPVRFDWAAKYRGDATVVYGHTPVHEAEWVNRTICIDTGCVFGGHLSALRYPEKELVSVPASRVYYEPGRPFEANPQAEPLSTSRRRDHVLAVEDVLGKRIISTRLFRTVTIREENATAAFEVMTRFAVDPRWLIHLPPTMSPSETSNLPEVLEHPHEAIGYYRSQGVERVVAEEKHMGSRAILLVCRDAQAARARFGVDSGESGVIYTRTGRRFFDDRDIEVGLIERIAEAAKRCGLWQELATDWLCLDAEIMPWSTKAQSLIESQYAATAAAARASLHAASGALTSAASSVPELDDIRKRIDVRQNAVERYAAAYAPYCWPVSSVDDLRVAPFHLLASEGAVHTDRDQLWHLQIAARMAEAAGDELIDTQHRTVDVTDQASIDALVEWWDALTTSGGEGIVLKPIQWNVRGKRGLVQPALKCRGREYLRIIYGPEYTLPHNLERLRRRGLRAKRSLAQREYALGMEALHRFVDREPLYRVHECVFGVLALESEPVDPRL